MDSLYNKVIPVGGFQTKMTPRAAMTLTHVRERNGRLGVYSLYGLGTGCVERERERENYGENRN